MMQCTQWKSLLTYGWSDLFTAAFHLSLVQADPILVGEQEGSGFEFENLWKYVHVYKILLIFVRNKYSLSYLDNPKVSKLEGSRGFCGSFWSVEPTGKLSISLRYHQSNINHVFFCSGRSTQSLRSSGGVRGWPSKPATGSTCVQKRTVSFRPSATQSVGSQGTRNTCGSASIGAAA